MLDVHPPHHPTHGWRDFFIHIATITVGLLIAVGLEQTVEFFHHRHQVAQTIRELEHERELNRQRFLLLYEDLDRFSHSLAQDAMLFQWLRQHPHTPPDKWPAQPDFTFTIVPYSGSAWKSAQLSGVLDHMPHREVKQYDELYARLADVSDTERQLRLPIFRLRGLTIDGPLQDLTPAQWDNAWQALTEVRTRTAEIVQLQHNILVRYRDFPSDEAFGPDRALLLNEHRRPEEYKQWLSFIDHLNAIDAEADKE